MIEVSEQIKRLEEFFSQAYKKQILQAVAKGNDFVIVNFQDLLAFDAKIAEELLDNPEEVIKSAQAAVEALELPSEIHNFKLRFKNIPDTQKIMISDVRSKHIGKLLTLSGIVRQKSDVRPQATVTKFECPNCGNVIAVLQLDTAFREPEKCGCGRKGRFRLIEKGLVDAQAMVLEESADELDGSEQPKRINAYLKEDLVSPLSDKRTNPGSRVVVVGTLKEIPVIVKGVKSTRYDLLFEANYTEAVAEDFYQIEISKEEEKKIQELAQDPKVNEKLVESLVPSIHGYAKIKEALLLQLFGGVQKKRSDGVVSRGDCHILLVGDPGAGKSQILKRISSIAPKGRYVSGKGASGAGLTAAVVKDEFLGGWSLEAGALVLSNNGLVAIDEMDKMTDEDRAAMHEALEQQCYHYDTGLLFADGSTQKIGEFVERLMSQHKGNIVEGHDCQILALPALPQVLTTDFSSIWPVTIQRVSRHRAPDKFYRITYSNGRSLTVTPEHPLFYVNNASIETCMAKDAKPGMLAPAPARLPIVKMQEEEEKKEGLLTDIRKLNQLLVGDIRFVKIVNIEEIPNIGHEWTYDITVEPTHTFITQNLVVHNSISIAKANIQATLSSKTTVLAAANPKFGRFDPHGILAEQIDMPPTLINRFDLIFPIKDIPNAEYDEKLAKHILELHQKPQSIQTEIPTNLLKKYVAYSRQRSKPELTDQAITEIKDYYVQMRNRESSDERASRSIPISARQLEALVRLAEANAKVRLSDKVTKKDARKAIELLTYCLMQVGLDKETGKIDIDRISTGIGASQRDRIYTVKDIVQQLESRLGKAIPLEEVQKLAQEKGMSMSEVDEIIERLKRQGDLYEPRFGFLSRV